MIRMLIPLIIIFLVYLLAQTLMNRSEPPIDVDPIDPSTEKGGKKDDDDIIDVEPVE